MFSLLSNGFAALGRDGVLLCGAVGSVIEERTPEQRETDLRLSSRQSVSGYSQEAEAEKGEHSAECCPGVLLPRGQDCGGDQHCPEVSAEDLCGVRGRGAQDPEGRLRPHPSPRPGDCPLTSYNKNPGN